MFHTDDLMTPHESSTIFAKHIKLLDEARGATDPLIVTRCKTYECLGKTIDFSVKRGVAATQCNFEKKLWVTLLLDLKENSRSAPAPDSSFKVDENAPLLNCERKDKHHATTTKMLWASQ